MLITGSRINKNTTLMTIKANRFQKLKRRL